VTRTICILSRRGAALSVLAQGFRAAMVGTVGTLTASTGHQAQPH
jgi:hypothetical protein